MSSTSGITLNPSANPITDHSQLAKDIDAVFKSSSMRGPQPLKAGIDFTEWAGLIRRVSARQKLISAVSEIS